MLLFSSGIIIPVSSIDEDEGRENSPFHCNSRRPLSVYQLMKLYKISFAPDSPSRSQNTLTHWLESKHVKFLEYIIAQQWRSITVQEWPKTQQWSAITLVQEWPKTQQWLRITLVQQRPTWCGVKNIFGNVNLLQKVHLFNRVRIIKWRGMIRAEHVARMGESKNTKLSERKRLFGRNIL
jgi:hypothetical protein